jgi:hydroxyacylglutathione hydrolase
MTTTEFVQFENSESNIHYEGILDVEPRELNKHRSEVVLIDVREPDEFQGELGHIPGATLKPLGLIEDWCSSLPKNKTIVFVCRSGGRSARASAFAYQKGYKNIYNLKGGMILWNELHLPTEA